MSRSLLHPELAARAFARELNPDVKAELAKGVAAKFDSDKAPMWYLPWEVLKDHIRGPRRSMARALVAWIRREPGYLDALCASLTAEDLHGAARVLDFGARKYAPFNWENGFAFTRIASAGLRHATDLNELDAETDMPHAWHLACNVVFAITHELRFAESDLDDRPEAP